MQPHIAVIETSPAQFRAVSNCKPDRIVRRPTKGLQSVKKGVQEALQTLADTHGPIDFAVVLVAGPVRAGRARLSKVLGQEVLEQRQLAKALGIDHVLLLSDTAGMAKGAQEVSPSNLVPLTPHPLAIERPRLVVLSYCAGLSKGLIDEYGQATSEHREHAPMPFPIDSDENDKAVLRFFRFHRVPIPTIDQVLGGRTGFMNLVGALAPNLLSQLDQYGGPGITELAERGDAEGLKVITTMCRYLGHIVRAEAIAHQADGVVLSGSVALALQAWLTEPNSPFLQRLQIPGEDYVRTLPVLLYPGDDLGIRGAFAIAAEVVR